MWTIKPAHEYILNIQRGPQQSDPHEKENINKSMWPTNKCATWSFLIKEINISSPHGKQLKSTTHKYIKLKTKYR